MSGGIENLKIITSRDNSHFGAMLPTLTPQTSIINHQCTHLLKSRYDEPSHHNTERPQSADRRDGLCIQITAACTSILYRTVRVIADSRKLEVCLLGVSPTVLKTQFTEYSTNYCHIRSWTGPHMPNNQQLLINEDVICCYWLVRKAPLVGYYIFNLNTGISQIKIIYLSNQSRGNQDAMLVTSLSDLRFNNNKTQTS